MAATLATTRLKVSANVFVGNHTYDDARGSLQDRHEGRPSI
ncbi:MAG: hypothetical protein ACHQ9S_11675 [Candidatus Binatia bacterium]